MLDLFSSSVNASVLYIVTLCRCCYDCSGDMARDVVLNEIVFNSVIILISPRLFLSME